MWLYFFQIKDEDNVLQDGTLIDLCGATLLWRSALGLISSPVSLLFNYRKKILLPFISVLLPCYYLPPLQMIRELII